MEPNYVADNGYINAFAVAWLFQEDHLFFKDDEITWDGKRHGIAGIQCNAENMNEIPEFMGHVEDCLRGVVDFLGKLEQQSNLIVPRASIHKALYPAIRKGDLTGFTLFNLLACAKALMISRQDADSYMVIYDTNLANGIPRFSELVGNLITFMREYNDVKGDFTVVFAGSRNFDFAQAFLKGNINAVSTPVADAKFEPVLKLRSGDGYSYTNTEGEVVQTKNAEKAKKSGGAEPKTRKPAAKKPKAKKSTASDSVDSASASTPKKALEQTGAEKKVAKKPEGETPKGKEEPPVSLMGSLEALKTVKKVKIASEEKDIVFIRAYVLAYATAEEINDSWIYKNVYGIGSRGSAESTMKRMLALDLVSTCRHGFSPDGYKAKRSIPYVANKLFEEASKSCHPLKLGDELILRLAGEASFVKADVIAKEPDFARFSKDEIYDSLATQAKDGLLRRNGSRREYRLECPDDVRVGALIASLESKKRKNDEVRSKLSEKFQPFLVAKKGTQAYKALVAQTLEFREKRAKELAEETGLSAENLLAIPKEGESLDADTFEGIIGFHAGPIMRKSAASAEESVLAGDWLNIESLPLKVATQDQAWWMALSMVATGAYRVTAKWLMTHSPVKTSAEINARFKKLAENNSFAQIEKNGGVNLYEVRLAEADAIWDWLLENAPSAGMPWARDLKNYKAAELKRAKEEREAELKRAKEEREAEARKRAELAAKREAEAKARAERIANIENDVIAFLQEHSDADGCGEEELAVLFDGLDKPDFQAITLARMLFWGKIRRASDGRGYALPMTPSERESFSKKLTDEYDQEQYRVDPEYADRLRDFRSAYQAECAVAREAYDAKVAEAQEAFSVAQSTLWDAMSLQHANIDNPCQEEKDELDAREKRLRKQKNETQNELNFAGIFAFGKKKAAKETLESIKQSLKELVDERNALDQKIADMTAAEKARRDEEVVRATKAKDEAEKKLADVRESLALPEKGPEPQPLPLDDGFLLGQVKEFVSEWGQVVSPALVSGVCVRLGGVEEAQRLLDVLAAEGVVRRVDRLMSQEFLLGHANDFPAGDPCYAAISDLDEEVREKSRADEIVEEERKRQEAATAKALAIEKAADKKRLDKAKKYIRKGAYVAFGRYPRYRDGDKLPLIWYVAQVSKGYAVLITRDVVARREYSSGSTEWKTSSLRSWLNKDFFAQAFVLSEEKALCFWSGVDKITDEKGDKVLILDSSEVDKCFSRIKDRAARFTDFAKKGPQILGAEWWLRGRDWIIKEDGCTGFDQCMFITLIGVRPAICLDLRKIEEGMIQPISKEEASILPLSNEERSAFRKIPGTDVLEMTPRQVEQIILASKKLLALVPEDKPFDVHAAADLLEVRIGDDADGTKRKRLVEHCLHLLEKGKAIEQGHSCKSGEYVLVKREWGIEDNVKASRRSSTDLSSRGSLYEYDDDASVTVNVQINFNIY